VVSRRWRSTGSGSTWLGSTSGKLSAPHGSEGGCRPDARGAALPLRAERAGVPRATPARIRLEKQLVAVNHRVAELLTTGSTALAENAVAVNHRVKLLTTRSRR